MGFLGLVITERGVCKAHISSNWLNHFAVNDGPLQFTPGNREVAGLLQRLLSKCETFEGDLGNGLCANRRPNPRLSLLLLSIEDAAERDIVCGAETVSVVPCADSTAYQGFWRRVLKETNLNSRSFDDLVEQAFWGIVVHPDAADRWDKMGHALSDIREKLVSHLAYLSDQCARDFRSLAGVPSALIARAGSNHVDMSPENTSNLSDKQRKERRVFWAGVWLECLWHTKLHPGRGRIHFVVLDDDLVLVGVVAEHLGTGQ